MLERFSLVVTSRFQGDIRRLLKSDSEVRVLLDRMHLILEEDPCNQTRGHDIKKLLGVKPGEGQWRIRLGRYRARYDIFKGVIVLYSFRLRKEAYR